MNHPVHSCHFFLKFSAWPTAVVLVLALLTAPHAGAQAVAPESNIPLAFKAMNVGDTEAEVLRTLGVAPIESKRSVLVGVEKLLLTFEVGQHRIEVTLIGGRLLAKSATTKPSNWRLPW